MGVNLIKDPNSNISGGILNGVPQYEKFVPYAEFYAVKYNEVEFIINGDGTYDLRNAPNKREIANFLGFDSKTGLYTNRYTDDIVGKSVRVSNDEGFGISSIEIDIKSKMVPTVNITFIDVKGSSLFNPQQVKTASDITSENEGSPYAVLFDFPPPTFVLIMKGVFGKATRYVLHLLNYSSDFDSNSGNFIIKAKFVGKVFAPLSDTKIGWVATAPYIGESSVNISGDVTKGIEHFYELKIAGQQLYDKLNLLTSSSKEVKKIQEINDNIGIINQLSFDLTNFDLDGSIVPTIVNKYTEDIEGNIVTFDENDYPTFFINDEVISGKKFAKITLPFDKSNPKTISIVKNELIEKRRSLLDGDYKRLVGLNTFSENDITLYYRQSKTVTNINDDTTINIYFEYTEYLNKLNNAKKKQVDDSKIEKDKVLTKTQNLINQELGFQPTVKNIMKLLCNDIDIFYNKIKQAGEPRTGVKTDASANVAILDDAAWPRVTKKVIDGGVIREVAIYPGADEVIESFPDFVNWKEVQFVENFIKAYYKQRTYESELEEMKKVDTDGTKKLIPVNPFDSDIFGSKTKTLEYLNKNNPDQFLSTLLKRYFIATQYTYKGFWSDTYSEGKRLSLIEFLAKSEAQNVAASYFDEKMIDVLIQMIEDQSIFNTNLFLPPLDTYTLNNNSKFPITRGFIDNKDIADYYVIDGSTTIYPYKTDEDFVGIEQYVDFDPATSIIDTNSIADSEKPTKFLIEFINGDFLDQVFQTASEKPALTKDNLLYFKDIKKEKDKYDSDFIVTKSDDLVDYLSEFNGTDENQYNNTRKLTTQKELEDIVLTIILSFGAKRIDAKFSYPAIIDIPRIFLIAVGKKLSNDPTAFNLSQKDAQLFIGFYNQFTVKVSDLIQSFNNTIAVKDLNLDNIKNSELVTYLLESLYFVNYTSFTFINKDDSDDLASINGVDFTKFHQLLEKNSDGLYIESQIPFDTDFFGTNNEQSRINVFINTFKVTVIDLLKKKKKDAKEKKKDLNKILRDTDYKTQLYYSFKAIYDRWVKGTEDFKPSEYAYPYSGGKPLIDKFKFVDRAYNDIGDIGMVDFSVLLDYLNSPDSEIYGGISTFLAKNNYDFFPLPNFMDFAVNNNNNINPWQNAFNLEDNAEITTEPMFTCMYVGGFSSLLDDNVSFNNETKTPADMGNNCFAFNVVLGSQNQSIFQSPSFSTSEIKETGESLKLMDDLFKKTGNNSTPTPKGQNLFEVFENRAYSTKVTVPFGNMLIQPTQYFEILNVPLFNGVYIILEVRHLMTAESNRVETSFTGSRIKRYISPIVSKPIVDVVGIHNDLSQFVTINDTGGNTNNTPSVTQILKLNPTETLYRKDEALSNNVVRKLNDGTFVNDSRYLTFTSTTLPSSGNLNTETQR